MKIIHKFVRLVRPPESTRIDLATRLPDKPLPTPIWQLAFRIIVLSLSGSSVVCWQFAAISHTFISQAAFHIITPSQQQPARRPIIQSTVYHWSVAPPTNRALPRSRKGESFSARYSHCQPISSYSLPISYSQLLLFANQPQAIQLPANPTTSH